LLRNAVVCCPPLAVGMLANAIQGRHTAAGDGGCGHRLPVVEVTDCLAVS